MFASTSGRARVAVFLLLAAAAACSQTPTGPTSAVPAAHVGALDVEQPPVPPRIAPTPPRALGATRFLAFGDSLTQGVLSSFDGMFLFDGSAQSYSERLRIGLNAHFAPQTFSITNRGISGEWAVNGAQRIQSELTTYRPQTLLLLEGINDLNNGRSISATASALGQMLDKAALFEATVLIATMPQTYQTTDSAGQVRVNSHTQIAAFNNAIRQIAAGRLNVYVVDLYAAFGSNRDLIGGDGLHPTPQGYERMASTFMSALEAVYPIGGSFQ